MAKLAVMPGCPQDVLNLLQVTLTAYETLEIPVITMSMGKTGHCQQNQRTTDRFSTDLCHRWRSVGSRADSGREHERDTGYNFIRVRKGGSFSIRLLSDYGEKKPDFPPVSDKVCGALSL